jgi:hypothetical protein
MEVHNRDVFPTHDVQNLYSLLAPLISNSLIDKPFSAHEEAANRAKQHFHRRGRLALVLVLASTVFTVAQRLVVPTFSGLELVSSGFVLCGLTGLAIQIHLLVKKQKQIWLRHRFAAERLRSIKFQGYQFAMISASRDDLRKKVDAFYSREVAALENELNAGYSALVNFSPGKGIAEHWTKAVSASNSDIGVMAKDAYRNLRIAYQRRFAESEVLTLQQKQRVGYTAADILYLSGGVLAIAALTSKIIFPNASGVSNWIDFLAITAFVVGLVKTIMDNASLAETSKVRYEDYLRALDECETEIREDKSDFSTIVRRIERVVLGELSDFCQSASQISYRL